MAKPRQIPKGMAEQIYVPKRHTICLNCRKKINDCNCISPRWSKTFTSVHAVSLTHAGSLTNLNRTKRSRPFVFNNTGARYYCNVCGKTFSTLHDIRSHVARFEKGDWTAVRRSWF